MKAPIRGRFRFRSGEDFLETRIAPQRIPFPAQTQIGQCDVFRKIRPCDWAGCGEEALDQGDRLFRFACEGINQGQICQCRCAMERVLTLRLEFDCATTFPEGILFPAEISVEQPRLRWLFARILARRCSISGAAARKVALVSRRPARERHDPGKNSLASFRVGEILLGGEIRRIFSALA